MSKHIDEIPAGWRISQRAEFGTNPADYHHRYMVQRWGTREIKRWFKRPVIITVWNDVVSFRDREQAKQYIIDIHRALTQRCTCGEHGRQVPTS
jgi:hypothetical protein